MPLAWTFEAIVTLRRWAYGSKRLRQVELPVPVIVVGNITVGGTGKTPLVLWLAERMTDWGLRPGIVSRGYGGRVGKRSRLVTPRDTVSDVGDEALLLARRGVCPVCVGADRVDAARVLIEQGVNVIVSDDGLQHYRLARDLEIAVLDGERRMGNGRLLPAGPLREPVDRLAVVDLVLVNSDGCDPQEFGFRLVPGELVSLAEGQTRPLAAFSGKDVWVVAGIGNPGRFLRLLRAARINVHPVEVADHGFVDLERLRQYEDMPILMTEKDAVKYPASTGIDAWYLPVEVDPCPQTEARVTETVGRLLGCSAPPARSER